MAEIFGGSIDLDKLAEMAANQVISAVKGEVKKAPIQMDAQVVTDKGQIDAEGQQAKKEFESAVNPIELNADLNEKSVTQKAKKIRLSIDQLLNKDYSKGNLTKNLEKSFNAYNSQVAQSVEKMSLNGTKAAYNYYSAFNAAMEAGIDKNVLNKYLINDSYRSTTGDLYKNIGVEIDAARKKLEIFLSVEKDVKEQLGNIKINNSLLAKMNDYANKSYYDYSHPGDSEATYAAEEAQKRLNDAIQKVLASQNQLQQEERESSQTAQELASANNQAAESTKRLNDSSKIDTSGSKERMLTEEEIRKLAEENLAFDKKRSAEEELLRQEREYGLQQTKQITAETQQYLHVWEDAIRTQELAQQQRASTIKAEVLTPSLNINSLNLKDTRIPQYAVELEQLKNQFKLAGPIIGMTNEQIKAFVNNLQPAELETYKTEVNELENALNKLNKNELLKKNGKYGNFLGDYSSLDKAKTAFTELASSGKSFSNIITKDLGNGMTQFTSNVITSKNESQKLVGVYANGKLYTSIKQASQQTNSFQKFTAQLADRWRMVSQYMLSFGSFYRVLRMIRQGFTTMKELDDSLTEMRKVSDESLFSLKEYAKSSFDLADTVGTTSKQLQASTADFMRIGESMDEAAESAKAANVLLNVSEFDSIDEATESLIAMSAAFDDLSKTEINDVLNNLGKQKLPKRIVIYGRNFLQMNFRNIIPIAV